jgi:cobalt-zinc-cadmium efflux system protein
MLNMMAIALSLHLLMPGGYPGEGFIDAVAAKRHDRFEISHPTIQIESSQTHDGCEQPLQRR